MAIIQAAKAQSLQYGPMEPPASGAARVRVMGRWLMHDFWRLLKYTLGYGVLWVILTLAGISMLGFCLVVVAIESVCAIINEINERTVN